MKNEIKQGRVDDATFKKAIVDYRERIFLVILRFVRNREDARDLTQEAFVRAYKSRESFRGDASLYTWIYRIAVNLALNFKSRSHISSLTSLDDAPEMVVHGDPSDSISDKELLSQIESAIAQLPDRQRAVFILRYYEEKPHAEIAEMLGVTEGAVKANYHQAIRKLRKELTPYMKAEM
jgi:RNA polymerase sigma-70 factor (ECF subfamily)